MNELQPVCDYDTGEYLHDRPPDNPFAYLITLRAEANQSFTDAEVKEVEELTRAYGMSPQQVYEGLCENPYGIIPIAEVAHRVESAIEDINRWLRDCGCEKIEVPSSNMTAKRKTYRQSFEEQQKELQMTNVELECWKADYKAWKFFTYVANKRHNTAEALYE